MILFVYFNVQFQTKTQRIIGFAICVGMGIVCFVLVCTISDCDVAYLIVAYPILGQFLHSIFDTQGQKVRATLHSGQFVRSVEVCTKLLTFLNPI